MLGNLGLRAYLWAKRKEERRAESAWRRPSSAGLALRIRVLLRVRV